MILHQPRKRPDSWSSLRSHCKQGWVIPFVAFEWLWEWVAFALSNWRFLEVLEYLGSFSVLAGVIFYFSESGDRIKQRHYQAWQVINTAQGKGGNGGRIEALQELNADRVPLVGVDVSTAFLQGIKLDRASLVRADLSAVDARNSTFKEADLSGGDLHDANFRESNLDGVNLSHANLHDADLWGASLRGTDLSDADLTAVDLRNVDLQQIRWERIRSVRNATIKGVRNAPNGFVTWALKNGATMEDSNDK